MARLLPPGADRDAALLLETRGVRAFGDGLVSVVLAAYLAAVGLSDVRIGVVVTADPARLGGADAGGRAAGPRLPAAPAAAVRRRC